MFRGKKKEAKKRSGPQLRGGRKAAEWGFILLLGGMMLSGFGFVLWALFGVSGSATLSAGDLAVRNYQASAFLTGITTIYCGLTGFILLESRRMRLQAIMPHVQLSGPVRSPEAIVVDLQNAGAAPAVDVQVRAWILKLVGGTRTPEPAAVFIGTRHALPASPAPVQLKLVPTDHAAFASWEEHLERAGVAPGALDVHLLLVGITYRAVDGMEMSECMALSLTDQKPLPGDPA